MLLQRSTWPEVEAYLQQSDGIIIPIGSTEQHGPIGLIGTDAICAEAIAQGVADRCQAIVGPTINVGMALHHLAFPGSISLRPSTLLQVLVDYLSSLAQHGFRHFYFINGHGGNIATVRAAFAEFYAVASDRRCPEPDRLRCHLANWFMVPAVTHLARELYGDEEGSHATPSEVALTQFVHPKSIKKAPLTAEVNTSHAIYAAADFRRRYPDGRMGSNPALATPEQGQRFYEAAVAALSQSYESFLVSE
ncbi:creatininase family protein [Synechococcus elongatus]|uniref:Creatininase family protein n=1 Tax=Synechococcus elongatus PCC 11801 TaxID=2219813 RepID=A0AAN1QQ73_SYNEL|nr:creatininase family protein [Synechococcus elongatus]AZB73501.1 creatininase family protein [Synechococcus elongatus PCC 11801]